MTKFIDFQKTIEAGTKAAYSAGLILQAYSHKRADLVIDHKAQNDLVSQADRDAEMSILEVLKKETPSFGIVAEETGGKAAGLATWYIDPLDGTTNFLHGIPHYAVSIGLVAHAGTTLNSGDAPLEQDTPIAAVVFDPNRKEMFTALYKTGAWLNSHRISCSKTDSLQNAIVSTGFPYRDFSFEEQYLGMFKDAIHKTRGVRRFGAAALDLAWVACGRYDAFWEMGLAPWDVAAGCLLVREAGGKAEDMLGQDKWPIKGNIVSGNRKVYPELMDMITPHL